MRATSLCVLWACWLVWASEVRAEALTAVLRQHEPADASLLTRVRGQTGDLDVALRGEETQALERGMEAQLASARALSARVVIWVERGERGLRLVVADFLLERVLVRELAVPGRSAQEEAAALMARTALRASLAGSALGAPTQEVVPPPPPSAPPTPRVAAAPAPVVVHHEPGLEAELELGALSGVDGVSQRGHHALFLRAGLRRRRLELGVLGGVGLPASVAAPRASLKLAMHRLEASAGAALVERAAWSLSALAGAGVALLRLRAASRDALLDARAAREPRLALAAFLRVQYRTPSFAIALRAGIDVLPNALTLGYDSDAGFVRSRAMWTVMPALGLSLVQRIRHAE